MLADQSVQRADDLTVRYVPETFIEGYDRSKHLIALASADRLRLLVRLLEQSEEGRRTLEQYRSLVSQRWLEPDRVSAWVSQDPPTARKSRYHGDN